MIAHQSLAQRGCLDQASFHGRRHRATAPSLRKKRDCSCPAIISSLQGQPLLRVSDSCSAVPLLLPEEHRLPFAASLQIHHPDAAPFSCVPPSSTHTHSAPSRIHAKDGADSLNLVEINYVLSGVGCCSSSSLGTAHWLAAGDCIACIQGSATFTAAPASPGQPEEPAPGRTNSPAYREEELQPLHAAPREGNQLVLLQLLLPGEVLSGHLTSTSQHHQAAVAQHLDWRHNAAAAGTVSQLLACQLLAAALPLLQEEQPQQQRGEAALADGGAAEEAAQRGLQSRASSTVTATEQQVQEQVAPSHSSSSSSSPEAGPSGESTPGTSSSSSNSGGLTADKPAKRAVSEVGAWRLPNQTNRLALLFGPHAAPSLSISFGLEIFEPGHITPRHTHSSAHELFFVLAGQGLGVVGGQESQPQQQQQQALPSGAPEPSSLQSPIEEERHIVLSPGDVAVFPPGVVHAIDNPYQERLYCLQLMLPNESFVEYVTSGDYVGALDADELHTLAHLSC